MRNLVRIPDLTADEVGKVFDMASELEESSFDKREDLKDVVSYLANWVDGIIVRHSDIKLIEKMCMYSEIPVINAMTRTNHPCEILSDLYSIKKIRMDYLNLNYTFIGADGNIGRAWAEVSDAIGSPYFVGYGFKKSLYFVQQAIILFYCEDQNSRK